MCSFCFVQISSSFEVFASLFILLRFLLDNPDFCRAWPPFRQTLPYQGAPQHLPLKARDLCRLNAIKALVTCYQAPPHEFKPFKFPRAGTKEVWQFLSPWSDMYDLEEDGSFLRAVGTQLGTAKFNVKRFAGDIASELEVMIAQRKYKDGPGLPPVSLPICRLEGAGGDRQAQHGGVGREVEAHGHYQVSPLARGIMIQHSDKGSCLAQSDAQDGRGGDRAKRIRLMLHLLSKAIPIMYFHMAGR